MKKFLSLFLTLILILSFSVLFIGCGDNDDGKPVYAEEFTYDESCHWREQINGTGTIEYGYHRDDSGGGRCEVCHMYYECEDFEFRKITINGVEGYELYQFVDYPGVYLHVEVPKYYQGEDDSEPLPVISIGPKVFSCSVDYPSISSSIKSIKLNEGLLSIGNFAFAGSSIEELIIPDSVIGNHTRNNNGLYAVAYQCSDLERVVIGNGVQALGGYNFAYCEKLKSVKLGSSITEIWYRNFYLVSDVDYLVIPESVVSIPEGSIVVPNNGFNQRLVGLLGASHDKERIYFFEITEEEYNHRTIPAKERDHMGYFVNEEDNTPTTWGFSQGWDNGITKYFKGEWHYNDKGVPVPN